MRDEIGGRIMREFIAQQQKTYSYLSYLTGYYCVDKMI